MNTQDFLVELGTEELPSKALKSMGDHFAAAIIKGLESQQLSFESSRVFATPRRLALLVSGLVIQGPSQEIINEGPPKRVALDADGNFTKAAEAFAKKNQLTHDQLQFADTAKGSKLVHRYTKVGVNTVDVLADIVKDSVAKLPVPKRMRWGASRAEFSRPIQWLVLLFGEQTIETDFYGLRSNKFTRGHRFHTEHPIEIDSPASYEDLMRDTGHIIVDYDQRKTMIEQQVLSQAASINGTAVLDSALLDEVCGLVEYPVAFVGSFEERFLSVPKEALISSMISHQKYFPVVADNGDLMPYFIFISNIDSEEPQEVISGNERVIRPRLADAAFFYDTDLKTRLDERLSALDRVVFQTKLGSMGDKSRRIAALAKTIAASLNADQALAERAGLLAKADLVSEIVLEFDDLQGIAGSYYAINDGENPVVANAIKEHYLPKHQGDLLPSEPIAISVSLADKLDSLVGIFGIGLSPTGSKDPFALRRAALAIIRIIQDKQLDMLVLTDLVGSAASLYGDKLTNSNVVEDCFNFINDRYKSLYQDQAISIDCLFAVQAVTAPSANPYDRDQRVNAVVQFKGLAEAEALVTANKRVANILAKNTQALATSIDPSLLLEPAEKALALAITHIEPVVTQQLQQQAYSQSLLTLSTLKAPIDSFFEEVMVMADDDAIRQNRLALLSRLHSLFTSSADISVLQF